jgi:hypothetical protein
VRGCAIHGLYDAMALTPALSRERERESSRFVLAWPVRCRRVKSGAWNANTNITLPLRCGVCRYFYVSGLSRLGMG